MKRAYFDSRVTVLPNEDEVVNYCIWRQEDATRNAIQMLGQAHFSHKRLHEKNTKQVQEMLFKEKGINFNNEPVGFKRGRVIRRVDQDVDTVYGPVKRRPWTIDVSPPKFVTNKDYIREMFAIQIDV